MAYKIRKPNLMFIKILDKTYSLISHPNLIKLNKDYFYLEIPKSGSSFIRSSIIQDGNAIINISNKYPYSALFKRNLYWNSIDEKKIISFIRDPIERFCSVVRQKMMNKKFFKDGWNPSKFPWEGRLYTLSNINQLVNDFINLPINQTDKHIIPQNIFIKKYQNNDNLKIFHISNISKTLLEIGISEKSFPDEKISLKTNSNLFNTNDLSNKSISLLKSYYAEDYQLLEELNTNF